MPISLKSKIKKLRHQCRINEDEYYSLMKKIDGHDKEIREEVIDKVKKYIRLKTKYANNLKDDYVLAHEMYDWLDEQLKEQKNEQ